VHHPDNSLRGTITFDGALVSVSQLASTMMACAEPLMAQERAIARILGAAQQWREVAEGFVLTGPAGEVRVRR
jgi:heat shock protein HslJ